MLHPIIKSPQLYAPESYWTATTAAWAHKDAITALVAAGNIDALRDYNISAGWPDD